MIRTQVLMAYKWPTTADGLPVAGELIRWQVVDAM